MATVTVKAVNDDETVIELQELTPDSVPTDASSVQDVFSADTRDEASKYVTSYVSEWEDFEEVLSVFEDISGVTSVFEIAAYRGSYICPTVHLSVSEGREQDVVDEITAYYDGFHILESGDESVLVGFDSGAHLFGRTP